MNNYYLKKFAYTLSLGAYNTTPIYGNTLPALLQMEENSKKPTKYKRFVENATQHMGSNLLDLKNKLSKIFKSSTIK